MNLKSFLSSPRFKGNAEKTQQAIVLNASLWSIIALLVLMIIGNYLGGQTPLLVNTLNFSFVAICFGIRFILHRGWLKTVTGILIFIGTIYITFLIITLGTIRTPATMAYVMAVIFTGLQFGKKGVFLATTLISCIIGGLILAEQNSLLAKPDFTVGITQWISYTLQLGFTGILTLLALNITQRNLQRAEQEIERRKRVEKTLKTLSYAIDHNPASIIITGPNGEIQEVNPKFEQLTGYTIDEVRGKNLRLLQSGTHSKEFYKNLWGTITSGKEWFGEFHNKKKNGELYWEKASISPVLDENKRISHFVAVKEDITEQKRVSEEQKETNRQLQSQLIKITELQSTLHKQAMRDPLTGLYNRRYMDEALEKEFARAKREKYLVTLILLDLDYLKKFNDSGGHATGDIALRRLAGLLATSTRTEDIVCRFGGDEFIVILPNTTGENAPKRAEKWRNQIEVFTLLHRKDQALRITYSAGIATYPTHGQTIEEILKRADIALYRAKLNGRDRSELFNQEEM